MEPIPQGRPVERSSRVWWLALLLGACLAPAASQAAGPRVPPDLARRAAQEGEVRVLVQLAVEALPEPRLAPSARLAQRARIAAAHAALGDELRGASHRVLRAYRTLPFAAVSAGPAALARLERSPRVLGVQADRLHRPALDVSVPLVQADQTRALGFDGSGQVVAVIDTGVDGAHPNLAGKVAAEACFAAGDPFGSGDCPDGTTAQVGPGAGAPCAWTEGCFHGTHVAGIAVGDGPFFDGVAPGADTISIQVFTRVDDPLVCGSLPTPCAQAWASDLIAALEHVHDTLSLQHTIASVNMSLAGLNYASQAECDAANPAMKAAIDQLRAGGIASIAAAGNQGVDDQVGEPACISSAVSVSAVNDSDGIPTWANAAAFLSLWAPGQSIRAPRWQSIGYVNASGTSMATPHVAGGFAVLRQGAPSAPVDEIVTVLQSTGVPIPHAFASTTRIRLREAANVLFLHCQNGLDDDGDGGVDHPADLGCSDPLDPSERDPEQVCDDGSDNDSDDLADFPDDPGCATPLSPREDPACDDGYDNDGDGGTDHDGDPPDAQCLNQPWRASEWPTSCGIGFELAALLPLLWAARRRAAGVAAAGPRKYAPRPDGGVPPAA